jgi:hypothetical protein
VNTAPKSALLFTALILGLLNCSRGAEQSADSQRRPPQTTSGAAATPTPHAKPAMLSRQEWGAREPLPGMKRHEPSRVTVHHTATKQNPSAPLAQKMRALQNFSQNPGRVGAGGPLKPAWPDVPYHFYVGADGRIAEGRDVNYAGDTNTDYDPSGHILIVLEGDFEREEPSAEQIKALHELAAWAAAAWRVPADEIKGHDDYAATLCPGKNLRKLLPDLQRHVRGGGR